jgi:hypothetical protein
MTMELVLIFTILGLGVLVGIVAIRNALVKFFLKKQSAEIYVVDSDSPQKVIFKAFDLDEHEAPRGQFVDPNVAFEGVTVNRRVIIAARDDRFTTRHRIFYETSTNCGVTDLADVCIVQNGNEDGDNLGIGIIPIEASDATVTTTVTGSAQIQQAGGIGYLYPMQEGPAYGIGRDVDSGTGFPGTLYRETADFCDPANVRSVWTSQEVVSGEPCLTLDAGVTVEAAKCPPGAQGGAIGDPCNSPPADVRCTTSGTCSVNGTGCNGDAECPDFGTGETCDETTLQCACPDTDNGALADNWVEFGANCCPPGTTEGAPGQCEIANNGTFRIAEPVLNDDGDNALSVFVPPFRVSVPLQPGLTWQANAPGGFEGAPPGAVIPGGTDVDSVDYATPPAGGESGPP